MGCAGLVIEPEGVIPTDGTLIFLGGPIQGAPNWQRLAVKIIHSLDAEIHIANPHQRVFRGDHNANSDWEHACQVRAAKDGAVLFWMARESKHRCDRCYGHSSRYHLGEWAARSKDASVSIAVGLEPGFTGEQHLRHRLAEDYPNIPVCRTLRQTCAVAVELARRAANLRAQLQHLLDEED